MNLKPEMSIQRDLLERTITERFERWRSTPGAALVLDMFRGLAANYYERYLARGVGCSVALIEEEVRDAIRLGNLEGAPERGFALNCHFCSRIVRLMIAEHPEWEGMFELRGLKEATV